MGDIALTLYFYALFHNKWSLLCIEGNTKIKSNK